MTGLSRWVLGLFTSMAGVFVLAALDSTLFFSFPFGIDAAVIITAARTGSLWWIVPVLATLGSTLGAAATFWMGAKIGEKGLDHYVSPRRLKRIRRRFREKGAVALAVLDLIPPPFPFTPFVLAAGALEVDRSTFFGTLVACRLIRFGGEAVLARIYGRQILGWLESDLLYDIVALFILLAVGLTAASIVQLARSSGTVKRRAAA